MTRSISSPLLILAVALSLSSSLLGSDDPKPIRREVYEGGKIYDISHRYTPEIPAWESSEGLGKTFLRLAASMKNGSFANVSEMKLSVHSGTHVDAPGHFWDNYYDAGFDTDSLDLQVLNGPALFVDVPRDKNITGNGIASYSKRSSSCANKREPIVLDKKVPLDLVYNYLNREMKTIGSSHGWVATMKDDGILHLQDDLNPFASHTDPKRIPLPPFVALPKCQIRFATNVAMSSSSPEDEDCVVAVKFCGLQLSFCRPAQYNSEWTNIYIEDPCFSESQVMYSKKDDMFRINGIGSHVIGSWDLRKHKHKPKLQKLRFQKFPKLTEAERELLLSSSRSTHVVESRCTGETFLVKWYKKVELFDRQTKALMVFKIDEQGNAVYTQDIGDLCIFLSNSEPFCVPASSFPGLFPNTVHIYSFYEIGIVNLADCFSTDLVLRDQFYAPYHIPPQNID